MQLKPLLRQLATTFEVTVDPTFTHNPEVTHVQFVDPTEVLASHRLYLSPDSGQLVQLAYSWHGHRQSVGLVNLGTGLTTIIAARAFRVGWWVVSRPLYKSAYIIYDEGDKRE
ncbi:hypothetical protein WP50_00120 [Lactiplantibacillus plantarum]|nr:hypothetical protein WP50_00120 [Lactiplantibacillus plantarum]